MTDESLAGRLRDTAEGDCLEMRRERQWMPDIVDQNDLEKWAALMNEAADEIDRLRAENERLTRERDDFAEQLILRSYTQMHKDLQEVMRAHNTTLARAQSAEAERDALRTCLKQAESDFENERLVNECHCTNVGCLTKERDAAEAALAEMREALEWIKAYAEDKYISDRVDQALRALLNQGGHDGESKGD